MRIAILAGAAALLGAAAARAEMSVVPNAEPNPIMDESAGPTAVVPGSVDPAYRLVEGLSDGVFNFVRRHVIGTLLPDRLTRNLKAAPRQGSEPLFDRNLHNNESRYLARARASYPLAGDGVRPPNEAQLKAWRSWAAAEQVSVAVDSFKDTMIERYQLELFGEKSGKYATDRRNWDPGFLTMAGILGSTFMYFNGMHGDTKLGALKLGFDLASGLKLRQALQTGADTHGVAGLELGYRNTPITLATEWGLISGHMKNERVGLNYRLHF
ncbi:MAG: hypothetical protein HY077_09905 [Elusimicrobia bacterium]|nr:hypothetical protein [Elusimicrobiota bacterium]